MAQGRFRGPRTRARQQSSAPCHKAPGADRGVLVSDSNRSPTGTGPRDRTDALLRKARGEPFGLLKNLYYSVRKLFKLHTTYLLSTRTKRSKTHRFWFLKSPLGAH